MMRNSRGRFWSEKILILNRMSSPWIWLFAAAVSSCGFASYRTIFRDAINHNFSAYVPGLLRSGELGDILALVAPRPFFVAVGNADRIFPFDGIVETVERARARYAELGVGDRLELLAVDGGHGFVDALREPAYRWLDRSLGNVA